MLASRCSGSRESSSPALETIYPRQMLYPFMLVALGSDVDTSFELLRANPKVWTMQIRG